MKIVIFGLAKSGTTALFYKIRNSLPPETVCLFEPSAFEPHRVKGKTLRSLFTRSREPHILAKVLPFRPHHTADVDSFSNFEKQILIVRDPRDRIISRFLYGIYDSEFCQHDDKVKAFLAVLRKKELDPKSVSLKTLLGTFAQLAEQSFSCDEWAALHRLHSIRKPLDFDEARPSLFLFKYEDMVCGRCQGLEEYLGMRLEGKTIVPPEFNRVTRTRNYGNWRDWFTAEDINYLRPILQPFLDRYYPEADWELSLCPSIEAEFCSDYVKRIVNDRRVSMRLPPLVWSR